MKCPRHFPRYQRTERTEKKITTFYQCPECKKVSKSSKRIPVAKFKAPGKRLRHKTPKRQQQEAEYNRERIIFLEAHPTCQRCGCRPSNQVHHKAGREGIWLLLKKFWAAVCGECHDWIENNRAAAKASGWLLPRRPSK